MSGHQREPGWIHNWEPAESSDRSEAASHPEGATDSTRSSAPASKGEALTAGARFASQATAVPGRLLIKLALLTSVSTTLLAGLGLYSYDGFGWWLPFIVGVSSLAVTGFFALRRKQLRDGLEKSGTKTVIDDDRQSLVILDENGRDPEYELHAFAQREGEAFGRARSEFQQRPARFLPRIEAAQRSLRTLVDPGYDAPWLEHDIRPTLVSFLATAISIPVCGFFGVITAIALILASGM